MLLAHMISMVTRFSSNEAPSLPAEERISYINFRTQKCINFGLGLGNDHACDLALYSFIKPSSIRR